MKQKKLTLETLNVYSFVTGHEAAGVKGGATGTIGCYSNYASCACPTAAPKTCMNP